MNCCNVTERVRAIKRALTGRFAAGMLAGVLAAGLAGCSDDSPTRVTADFDYSGTYVATYVVEQPDYETEYVYSGSNLSGLMFIRDEVYSLDLRYQIGMSVFGRSDSGTLYIGEWYVEFNTFTDSAMLNTPRGYYLPEKSELKINYFRENALWTETWKRATPVVDPDTSTYIPF
ncbi:MAG: hypothetical protein FVQ81_18015 [Candidatus Glassbacteria bacterium]|nr:hypothetical protein [Candidatus Glassbacteria bacterium]